MMPGATISYKNNGGYKIPLTNSSEDAKAVQRAWDVRKYLTRLHFEIGADFTSTPVQRRLVLGPYLPNRRLSCFCKELHIYVPSAIHRRREADDQRIRRHLCARRIHFVLLLRARYRHRGILRQQPQESVVPFLFPNRQHIQPSGRWLECRSGSGSACSMAAQSDRLGPHLPPLYQSHLGGSCRKSTNRSQRVRLRRAIRVPKDALARHSLRSH